MSLMNGGRKQVSVNKQFRTYWDFVAGTGGLYHMGPNKYRTYILDRLKQLGVISILEVGCGTAPIYGMIKENINWGFKYKGTDFANEMVEVARDYFKTANLDIQDARKLKEGDNRWDCVLSIDCLDHLDDYKAAIAEAARVAKKYVVISLWRDFVTSGTSLNSRNMMNKEEGEEPWEESYLQEYSKEVLEEEFKKNNLEIIEFTNGPEVNEVNQRRALWILKK